MEYLIRLVQVHETFRRPELESLARLHGIDLHIVEYSDDVCFCFFCFCFVFLVPCLRFYFPLYSLLDVLVSLIRNNIPFPRP